MEELKMKKIGLLKKVVTAVLAGAMMCSVLTACGGAIKMDDIKGDWTTDKMNGQTVAEYAASIGASEGQCVTNWTIKEDDTATVTSVGGSADYDIERKSDGFEVYEKGAEKKKENIQFSVSFNKDAGTLTYKVNLGGADNEIVLKKGTGTIEAAAPVDESGEDAAPADDGSEGGEDAAVDEGGEEATDEGGEEATDEGMEEEAE
jgi:hypothetical protein